MFTGIIETTVEVLGRPAHGLIVERPPAFDDVRVGSSIAVSGVCLSIIGLDDRSMRFDVTGETLKRTKPGSLQAGDRVNLERALKATARLEGHIVQGHIDGVGKVVEITKSTKSAKSTRRMRDAGDAVLAVQYPEHLGGLIVGKGSVAIDGVSLTVASMTGSTFSVSLIPETVRQTTLGSLRAGDRVNLEADVLGKYVAAMRSGRQ